MIPFNESVMVFVFNEGEFAFMSAFAFYPNHMPVLTIPEFVDCIDGENCTFDISVSDPDGDSIECFDDTALFDVKDCKVLFTPEVPGIYNVTIAAVDSENNRVEKEVKISIV